MPRSITAALIIMALGVVGVIIARRIPVVKGMLGVSGTVTA